ncbi:MAG: tRNA lysidine(34) synthetase TilS [Hydrotalea sp.]|nr:tRNA lysidine(34) synthetase TilS [Hydrotalea sp.]
MKKKSVEKRKTDTSVGDDLWQEFCQRLAAPDMAGLLAAEKTLLVALSGGGDSWALTMLLKKWCGAQGKDLVAVHINHGLRAAADGEAARLQKMTARYDVRLRVEKLAPFADKKNLHHRARRARYDALASVAREVGARVVMLGHQENDVAENLLMRLSRRAGIHGLAAMRDIVGGDGDGLPGGENLAQENQPIYFLRPLLAVPRADLKRYLQQEKITFFDDPSNDDDRFLRARTRKMLTRLATEAIATPADIAATARYLRLASDFIAVSAREKKSTIMSQDSGMVVLRRFYGKTDAQPVEPFLLHHWLRVVMKQWQESGASQTGVQHSDNTAADFPPPQDQVEKIIAATAAQQVIFDYPAYWVISDDKKILVIKKSPGHSTLIKPQEKIIWNKLYKIENHGETDCHVAGLGRGKNFLRGEWGNNFVGCSADDYLNEKTSRYFYAQQPTLFWQDEADYCLPTFRLYRTAGQEAAVTFSPLHI